MRATLKDIAAELNVSVNTVSRALRDMPDISDNTKRLVKETAERLGYRKNMIASNLRTNRSYTIGIVVPDYSNPAMGAIINGAESVARLNGYTLMTGCNWEDPHDEARILNSMIDRGVDGLLGIPCLTEYGGKDIEIPANIPFVHAVRKQNDIDCNYVICDDYSGAEQVADKLYDSGHRRFMYLSGLTQISSARERLEGFSRRLSERGIPREDISISYCDGSRLDSYRCIKSWLEGFQRKEDNPVTAIFAFSDYAACGVYMALKEKGYRIPEDISVVGYDNNEFSEVLDPPLCTVDNHFFDIGKRAAQRLFELIDKPGGEIQRIVTLPELVWRESVFRRGPEAE